jgi:hypothetical protein
MLVFLALFFLALGFLASFLTGFTCIAPKQEIGITKV